jgi:hypothetical protein
MNVSEMQGLDAFFMFAISACCLVIVSEDRGLSIWQRLTTSGVGFAAFAQAVWLVAVWSPSPLGFPWARLMFDGAVFAGCVVRVWNYAISCLGRAAMLATHDFHWTPHHHRTNPEQFRRRFGG